MVTNGKSLRIDVSEKEEALVRDILGHVAGKWPLWTLHILGDSEAPLRFARLLERVEGISQKMLTQTLRHLERDGLVSRTVYAEVPPRVEYALTPDGREILVRFKPFWLWIAGRSTTFEEARARFDGGTSSAGTAKPDDL
jgi:DNA-binding HxlR family transcriptional regulator